MADTKGSALAANTAPASGDLFVHVDISDTTMDAAGTTKVVTHANLLFNAGGLQIASSQTASFTAAVGYLYPVDLSGASADFVCTWPASANAGDRFGVIITATHATYELTHARNGLTYRGGTDLASLPVWQAGECVAFRYVGGTWQLEMDGRIKTRSSITDSTGQSVTRATFAALTFDTIDYDVGGLADLGNERINIRRGNQYAIQGFGAMVFVNTEQYGLTLAVAKNGATSDDRIMNSNTRAGLASSVYPAVHTCVSDVRTLAAGDYIRLLAYWDDLDSNDASTRSISTAAFQLPRLTAVEILS